MKHSKLKMKQQMLQDKLDALNKAIILTQDELMTVNNELSTTALDKIIDSLVEAYDKMKGKTNVKKAQG